MFKTERWVKWLIVVQEIDADKPEDVLTLELLTHIKEAVTKCKTTPLNQLW